MRGLNRNGLAVEVLCGVMLDLDREVDPAAWFAERGWTAEERDEGEWSVDAAGSGHLTRGTSA